MSSTLSGGNKIVTDGLVLYLDAANTRSFVSGATAWNDLTPNKFTGPLVNGPTFNSSNYGSIVFDGVNDYIETNYFGSNTSSYTFGVWIKYNTSVSDVYPITRGRDGMGSGWSILLGMGNGGSGYYFRSGVVTENGLLLSQDVSTVPIIGNWYYITGIWQYNIGLSLYVNGVFKNQSLQASTTLRSSTAGWTLASITTSAFFNCEISNVSIYDEVLSGSDILQNYNALKNRFGL